MTILHPMPDGVVLVAIDIAKTRNEVLMEVPGAKRRRRMTVLNTREEHDWLIALLLDLGRPVACAFEATGNYHRPIAWRLREAGFNVRLVSSVGQNWRRAWAEVIPFFTFPDEVTRFRATRCCLSRTTMPSACSAASRRAASTTT